MNTKPRLKLHLDGHISVLAQGSLGWTAKDARSFIAEHYGNLGRFAERFSLPYGAVCAATKPGQDRIYARTAGKVSFVRCVLGLETRPSEIGERLAKAHANRRAVLVANSRGGRA